MDRVSVVSIVGLAVTLVSLGAQAGTLCRDVFNRQGQSVASAVPVGDRSMMEERVQQILSGFKTLKFSRIKSESLSTDGTRLTLISESNRQGADLGEFAIRVIDVAAEKVINKFEGSVDSRVSADGKTIAVKKPLDQSYEIHDVDSGKLIRKVNGLRIVFSPENTKYLLAGLLYDSVVDLRSGSTLLRIAATRRAHAFSHDGREIWTVEGRNVSARDIASGELVLEYQLPQGANYYSTTSPMLFSKDGKIVTVHFEMQEPVRTNDISRVLVINRETGKSAILPFGDYNQFHISSDGRFVAVSDMKQVGVYDTMSLEKVYGIDDPNHFENSFLDASFTGHSNQLSIRRQKSSMTIDLD